MPLIDFHAYWVIFPAGIVIASIAMSTGIEGSAMWAPVLLVMFRVPPTAAVACGIFLMIFGFGSGVCGYVRKKKVVFRVAVPLLFFSIPFSLLGSYTSRMLPSAMLTALMGAGCISLALWNVQRAREPACEQLAEDLCPAQRLPGYLLSSIGGFFTGAIGCGLGEMNSYYFLVKNRYPATYASGTTVFIMAVTALTTSFFNVFFYNRHVPSDYQVLINVVLFAVPGVIIGGQVGVILAHTVRRQEFHYFLSVVFTIMAVLSLMRALG